MRRARCILIGLSLTAVGIVALWAASLTYIWTGGYELTVVLDTPTEPPAWVVCCPVQNRAEGDRLLKWHLEGAQRRVSPSDEGVLADPFRGEPIKVYVRLDGRDNIVFGELGDPQYHKCLLVVAEMRSGERVGKVVDLPDYRRSKEVRVSVP